MAVPDPDSLMYAGDRSLVSSVHREAILRKPLSWGWLTCWPDLDIEILYLKPKPGAVEYEPKDLGKAKWSEIPGIEVSPIGCCKIQLKV